MSADASEHRDALPAGVQRGRGAGLNPGNRYESQRLHVLGDWLDEQTHDPDADRTSVATEVIADRTRTVINHVDSPDLPFHWTINPYRGCEHGCIYCYARPDHERLGYSCGLDFETRIVAKLDAPELLRRELASPRWQPEPIVMCGVTDCYQPLERKLEITRKCLTVLAECRQPVAIVTKNRLVLRDLDLLSELARHRAVRVSMSITTLDANLSAKMEPRASSPTHRLEAVQRLAATGVPVTVMVAPVVPGLTDREMPAILRAAADAGAGGAAYILLRLPHQVKDLFVDWLRRHYPQRGGHVESLLRQTRDGQMYDCSFAHRHHGRGQVAEQIGQVFAVFARRFGLDGNYWDLNRDAFRRPILDGQMRLFDA